MLDGYQYPGEPWRHVSERDYISEFDQINPIVFDMMSWFDERDRENTVPKNHEELFLNTTLAADMLDEAVNWYLRTLLGEIEFRVKNVKELDHQMTYVMDVEYY